MRIPLASLPLHAVDLDGRITLRRGSDDEPEARVAVLGCDADAVRAAAPHLGAVLWLSLCDGPPATPPGPSRDELRALRRGGWVPALPVGRWTDGSGDGRALWWTHALEIAAADRARNAGAS